MALKTLSRWYGNLFNERVSRRLRSREPGRLSSNHLLISFDGRKSGKRYTLPVNYRRTAEGTLVVSTEARWWRNLEGGANVEVLLGGEVVAGHATPIVTDPVKRARLGRILAGVTWPLFARSLVVIEIATP